MEQLNIVNLIRTNDIGEVFVENFIALSYSEVHKKVCEYLFDGDEELFEEKDIQMPTQSIEFITEGENEIYPKLMWDLINELHEQGASTYEVDHVRVDVVIKDNVIKELNFASTPIT